MYYVIGCYLGPLIFISAILFSVCMDTSKHHTQKLKQNLQTGSICLYYASMWPYGIFLIAKSFLSKKEPVTREQGKYTPACTIDPKTNSPSASRSL